MIWISLEEDACVLNFKADTWNAGKMSATGVSNTSKLILARQKLSAATFLLARESLPNPLAALAVDVVAAKAAEDHQQVAAIGGPKLLVSEDERFTGSIFKRSTRNEDNSTDACTVANEEAVKDTRSNVDFLDMPICDVMSDTAMVPVEQEITSTREEDAQPLVSRNDCRCGQITEELAVTSLTIDAMATAEQDMIKAVMEVLNRKDFDKNTNDSRRATEESDLTKEDEVIASENKDQMSEMSNISQKAVSMSKTDDTAAAKGQETIVATEKVSNGIIITQTVEDAGSDPFALGIAKEEFIMICLEFCAAWQVFAILVDDAAKEAIEEAETCFRESFVKEISATKCTDDVVDSCTCSFAEILEPVREEAALLFQEMKAY